MKNNIKEKNFISAIIYVHNYEKEIYKFIKKVNKELEENFEKYEIICVNDGSTDKSVTEIKKASDEITQTVISIVNMSYFQGKELSMQAGIDLSIGDFVYEFDNIEIDYDLNVIMQIYKESLKGFDIVSAKSDSNKLISSKLFYKVFNKNTNNMYNINTESFRILSRRAINRVKSINKTIPYRKAVYANCGLKLKTIEYKSVNKKKSIKMSRETNEFRKGLAVESIILFTDVSSKYTMVMSMFMILVTIITGIYTICIAIASKPIEGWTTTMLLLSFAFFGIFSILTIMIKYLSIIIDLIFKKQNYIVESVEKITK